MADEVWGPFETEEAFAEFEAFTKVASREAGRPVAIEMLRNTEAGIYALVRDLTAAAASLAVPGTELPDAPPAEALDRPDSAPPGAPGPFVSGRKTAHLTITYLDAFGRGLMRQGGTRAWRNCNPGNIERGAFAKGQGAIGDDGRFAVFPDEAKGFAAVIALLQREDYRDLSLNDAIFRYAPPNENSSQRYVDFISRRTGIAPATRLATLGDGALRALAEGIKVIEGWKPGSEIPLGAKIMVEEPADAPALLTMARSAQDWMDVARQEAARPAHERSEWPGGAANPRILEYFRVGTAWREVTQDETDWCAAFVNYCLVKAGHAGTGSPGARSFFHNRHGRFQRLDGPKPGCVVVIRRAPFDDPAWAEGPGHVGFFLSGTETRVRLLGGNQGNTVCEKDFLIEERRDGRLAARVVAYMMPLGA